MSHLAESETYTVQDYLRWEGDWELIHGAPVAMAPSPALGYQQLSAAIFRQLDESLDDCPLCQALFGIDVEFAADTVVRPDVLVICYTPEGERLTRAPDLVFEVVSQTTSRRDEVVKFDLYRSEGVANYVLVYPEAHKAKVYRLIDGEYRKVADFCNETHHFELSKCALDFDFSRLWRRKAAP
ncbi:MAG: Uma2 family endonuclease [Sulfurimicrobium sp.]